MGYVHEVQRLFRFLSIDHMDVDFSLILRSWVAQLKAHFASSDSRVAWPCSI